MQPNQTSIRNGIQDVLFPHAVMNITQGNNGQFTHQGVNALDLAERDAGRSPMYAPFDVRCVAIDTPTNGNAVFWESTNPVRFADGSIDYATIMIIHDNDLTGIHVGVNYSQGVQIANEGTAGYATGNHNHFEIAKGKFNHMYDRNAQGTYHLPNSISADQACFIDGTDIINGDGMAWKITSDISTDMPAAQPEGEILNEIPSDYEFENGTFTCTVDKINIRQAPTTGGKLTGDWYENGMSVKYDGFVRRGGYVWISWIGQSGTRRWMAGGELTNNVRTTSYGTFQ